MAVVRQLQRVDVGFGGEEHQGWLPPGAARPPATPLHVVKLDFEIREEEGGFLLVWNGPATEHCGDTWHPSLSAALEQAKLWFGIEANEWNSV